MLYLAGETIFMYILIYKFWTKEKLHTIDVLTIRQTFAFHIQRSFPVECTFSAVHFTREKSFDEATSRGSNAKKNLNEHTQKLVRIITDTKFQSWFTRYKERPLVSKQAKNKCQLHLTFVVVKPKFLFIFFGSINWTQDQLLQHESLSITTKLKKFTWAPHYPELDGMLNFRGVKPQYWIL